MLTNRPVLLLSYLGATLQELAFRASNLSIIGPRLASLIGGMIAATALLGWLLSRQTPKSMAWLLALVFLLEPIFVQSYRGARVDCWAFALCFSSCWMLRLAMARIQNAQTFTWLVALAGSLTAANIFVWPSAFLLYPLVILELVELIWRVQALRRDWKTSLWQIIAFALGGGITATLLVIPIWQQLTVTLSDLRVIASGDSTLRERSSLLTEIINTLKGVLSTYKTNPLLPIIALIGVIFSREKKLILTTLFLFTLLLITKFYTFRAVYLLPYILCLISGIYQDFEHRLNTKIHRRIVSSLLILLLTWSVVLSLIVRPALALSQKEGREPQILYNAGVSSIGAGSHKIYLDAGEFYYVGRSLGWKMFFPFDRLHALEQRNDIEFQQFLSSIDYAILSQKYINPKMISRIEESGLRYKETLVSDEKNKVEKKRRSNGVQAYGPYILYIRGRL
ncbi:hypothetical protein [Fischerella sp. PCC 9605]|uniref:hypothetical protein n=1 Tax=Fischerella sp. PCC 9605 TaxID=1173024 RepID=UPI0018CC3BFC|nr:hypothetical protein [Fischerella sp. PCC 9605]